MQIVMLRTQACINLGKISKTILPRAEGNMFLILHECYLIPHCAMVFDMSLLP